MPTSTMPQVKTVVHLMLENRSLDNLLGWMLYEGGAPQRVFPENSSSAYDGLIAGRFSQPLGSQRYPIVPLPDQYAKHPIPIYDPYEAMRDAFGAPSSWNGVMNQLFGNQNIISGMPRPGTPPTMQGFYQDYYSGPGQAWQGEDILWAYHGTVPIMNILAQAYSLSDAWFSSVPTETDPNRAYSLIGTSQGRENNRLYERYVADTIFNALGKAGKRWGLYYTDLWTTTQCYTQFTFPNLSSAPNGEIATHTRFFDRAAAGTLPNFTYLEPSWGYSTYDGYTQGTDYHPPTKVRPAEIFLFEVFQALKNSPQWDELLFIITFDEHGGTYDHVPPAWGAKNPDNIRGTRFNFNFDLFGVRVPTILVSPFAYPSSVFRAPAGSAYPFDHTSVIRTLLAWAGVDLNQWNFGQRVQNAPMFDYVLADHHVNFTGLQAVKDAFEAQTPEAEDDPRDLTALFAGVPHAYVRTILHDNKTLEDIQSAIAEYHRDPQKFEAALGGT